MNAHHGLILQKQGIRGHRTSTTNSARRYSVALALSAVLGIACSGNVGGAPGKDGGAGSSSAGASDGGSSGAGTGGRTGSGAGGVAGAVSSPVPGAGDGGASSGATGGNDTGGNGAAGNQDAAGSGGSGSVIGGSAGAAGAGGADGSAPYDPCPTNGDPCRVMPLGDSITDGCCGQNTISQGASYRYELFHLSLQNHKKLTFVGSHESGPNTVDGVAFPKHQEGHPGWTIADGGGRSGLQTQTAIWLTATPPDIVTLMIGTNDVDIQLDLQNAPKRLGTLVDTITETAPKALVVLAQITPTGNDSENERDRTFNAAMPPLVKERADAGKHVVLVDMYDAFTKDANFKTTLLANSLHPTDAGYAVLADVWWAVVGPLLPNGT